MKKFRTALLVLLSLSAAGTAISLIVAADGNEFDIPEVTKYAEQGDAIAQYYLGSIYRDGAQYIQQDYTKGP